MLGIPQRLVYGCVIGLSDALGVRLGQFGVPHGEIGVRLDTIGYFVNVTGESVFSCLLVLQNNQQTSSWSITLMVVVGHGMRTGAHLAS